MPERLSKKGIFGLVYGFASVGWLTDHGPLLGTLVTDVTRWRWIFYINLPVGVIALVGLLLFLPTNVSLRVWLRRAAHSHPRERPQAARVRQRYQTFRA